MAMNKMREEMVQEFLNVLKQDEIPWERGWQQVGILRNAVTNHKYSGLNSMWLAYWQKAKGYEDPRWCTFKQAQDKGWQVKKGEKGTRIEFWSMYDTETKKKLTFQDERKLRDSLSPAEFEKRVKPISSIYAVFNGEQIEGIPEVTIERYELDEEQLLEKREVLLRNMELGFREGGDRAFYRPSEDSITMPLMERFKSTYAYMSVFLHEAGHATGAEHRLNRNLSGHFGSETYAKEELRAEIASAFVSQALGISESDREHFENHKAYVQNWIQVLENNPQELFSAVKDAEKISDYLIEKGEFVLQKEKTVEIELSEDKQHFVTEHKEKLEGINKERTPLVINAFGGPGSGKTTACLDICRQLRELGYNAEYVQEYPLELVNDKNWDMLDGTEAHQFEILQEQLNRIDRLVGQADFIVTDSSILVNAIYNQELTPEYSKMLTELYGQYENFAFFMKRDEASFQQEGRIHDFEQSKEKDLEIKKLLQKNGIYHGTYTHENIDKVVQNAVTTYNRVNEKAVSKEREPEEVIQEEQIRMGLEKGLDVGIDYGLIQNVAEIEKKQNIPESERMTEWVDDKSLYEVKRAVTNEEIQKRYDEFKTYYMPLLSTSEAASIRLATKGRSVDESNFSPIQLQVGKLVKEYLDEGLDIKEVIGTKMGEIGEKVENSDISYIKNLVCSIYASDRESYEEYLNIPSTAIEEIPQRLVSGKLATKLFESGVDVYTYDNGYQKISGWKDLCEIRDSGSSEFYTVADFDINDFSKNLEDYIPNVECVWSESPTFKGEKLYLISEFNDMMKQADDSRVQQKAELREKYGGVSEIEKNGTPQEISQALGYDKVKFMVNTPHGDITERRDIGDGYGSMLEFLKEAGRSRDIPEILGYIEKEMEFQFLGYYHREHDDSEYVRYIEEGKEFFSNGVCKWESSYIESITEEKPHLALTPVERIDSGKVLSGLQQNFPYGKITSHMEKVVSEQAKQLRQENEERLHTLANEHQPDRLQEKERSAEIGKTR